MKKALFLSLITTSCLGMNPLHPATIAQQLEELKSRESVVCADNLLESHFLLACMPLLKERHPNLHEQVAELLILQVDTLVRRRSVSCSHEIATANEKYLALVRRFQELREVREPGEEPFETPTQPGVSLDDLIGTKKSDKPEATEIITSAGPALPLKT